MTPEQPDPCRFAARVIEASKIGLSSYATQSVLANPDPAYAAERVSFEHCARQFAAWLEYLAAALHTRRADVFTEIMVAARIARATRGLPTLDLSIGLAALDKVLTDYLPADAVTAVRPFLDAADHALRATDGSLPGRIDPHSSPTGRLAAEYLMRVLAGNRRGAMAIVRTALDGGTPIRDVYLEILAPTQREVGLLWLTGEINVAEEHRATAVTEAVMAEIRGQTTGSASGPSVLAATVQDDHHAVGIRMVADFFEWEGWSVTYLGCNVPSADLVQTLSAEPHDLLALAVNLPPYLRDAENLIRDLRAIPELKSLKILVGGPAFARTDSLWREIGADGFASDAASAVAIGAQLVASPR